MFSRCATFIFQTSPNQNNTNEIYLLTGVAGNLGSSIGASLLAHGKKVRGLVLNGDPAGKRVPKEIEVCYGDIIDPDSIERFFKVEEGMEVVVIHCAAFVTVNPNYDQRVFDVNVGGTKNMVDACVAHKVKKLVYIGSTSAIPEQPNGLPITEVDHYDAKTVVGFYGQTKAMASQIVMDAVHEYDLDASLVFPGGICGPDDYAYGPVASFIIDYCSGKMPGGIEGSFEAADSRDQAEAIVACCEKGRKGEGYLLTGEHVTMKELFHILSELTGTKEVKMIFPKEIGNMIGNLCDSVDKIAKKPMRMTSFAVYNLVRNNNFDSSKARRELDYTTRSFSESMGDAIAWLAREGKIDAKIAPACKVVCSLA